MKEKLWFFIGIMVLAVAMAIFASERKIITCSNINKTCSLRVENLLTKSVKEHSPIDLSEKPRNRIVVGNSNFENYVSLKCGSYSTSSAGKHSSSRTVYQLLPFSERTSRYTHMAINEYSSGSQCKRDKSVIENYFRLDNTEDLVYNVPLGGSEILSYFLAFFFTFMGFLVLFKGKVVSSNEIQVGSLTPEQEQKAAEIEKKMKEEVARYAKFLNKFNK